MRNAMRPRASGGLTCRKIGGFRLEKVPRHRTAAGLWRLNAAPRIIEPDICRIPGMRSKQWRREFLSFRSCDGGGPIGVYRVRDSGIGGRAGYDHANLYAKDKTRG
ncbi:hypothetical protein Hesp01_08930 [Herbidospora sp. NBRC 101105]|nr:hypothetical protein Hesp01_08930 [Herbidospora sp. NBRC 101105]